MSDRAFLDTNVLVYLFDADSPEKKERAAEVVARHGSRGSAVISTQVLQEFYVAVTRKLAVPLSPEEGYESTRELAELSVVQIDVPLVLSAIRLSQRAQLSFWDGLIVQAAVEGGCKRLLSEDLQGGRVIEGVEIENPFA